ncbi:MAG: hypothetical protein CVU50_06100 [Candidatus Cloacimonetes bacterium HGW-Cloacimonetes-3]|jgi:hypothetical protein|nr:MAG: hypothetical protein CVU50_06100 [Candidatus Cloacimonetes bacterium HGW-Cloacimonetes-3]
MKNRLGLIAVLCFMALGSLWSQMINNEGFEGTTFPPAGWNIEGAVTRATPLVGSPAPSPANLYGNYSVLFTEYTQGLIAPKMANPYTLTISSFQIGNGLCAPLFYWSNSLTGPWTTVDTFTNISNDRWTTQTVSVGLTDVFLKISYRGPGGGQGTDIQMDNITITPTDFLFTYRTVKSGNWNDPTTWEYTRNGTTWYAANIPPSASGALTTTILSGHTVTVAANTTADEVVVNTGGTLTINSGVTFTLNNGTNGDGIDLKLNGNMNIAGTFTNTGASMTCSSGTTVTYNGSTAQTTGSGFAPTVYNLVINNPAGLTLSANLAVDTKLTMTSGSLALGAYTLAYGTSATLEYNGTTAQTVSGEWLSTMTKNITNNNTSASGVTLNGNKTAYSGILTNNQILNVATYSIAGTGTVINNKRVVSRVANPVTTSTFTQATGSIIEYSSLVTLPTPYTYQNLLLSSSSSVFPQSGIINVNETFASSNGASLNPSGYRMFFPSKYVSVGGTSNVTAFSPATYVETPSLTNAVGRTWTFTGSGSGTSSVSLHWDNAQGSGLSFPLGSKIWQYNGSSWVAVAITGAPVADGGTRMMVSFPITLGSSTGKYAVTPAGPFYYRTIASGNWANPAIWECSDNNSTWFSATVAPTDVFALTTTIRTSHTVTVAANVSADEVVVNLGGTLFIAGGSTLTLNNGAGTDLAVNGTLNIGGVLAFNSGATISYGSQAALIYSGTASQTVGAEWPSTLAIDITNNNNVGVVVDEDKTGYSGTFNNNGILVSGTYYITGSGTFINTGEVVSTVSDPVTTGTFSQPWGAIIEYTNDVTLPSPFVYQNLVLNSASTEFDLGGNIDVNETFTTQVGASLDLAGYRMFFPFKYVSVGGTSTITAFSPETYVEAPALPNSVARKWTFSGAANTTTKIYLHWDNEQGTDLDFSAGSRIWRFNGSEWVTVATAGVPVADGATRMMVSFDVTFGTKADIISQYGVTPKDETLPVELSSFTAAINSYNYVQLQWVTQSETNCAGFNIYRGLSDDFQDAELLNFFIPATNTSQSQSYLYKDTELSEDGVYYYWLANLNLDGNTEYHGPVQVSYNTNLGHTTPPVPIVNGISNLYPNPFNPVLHIEYGIKAASDVRLEIYNLRGQVVRSINQGLVQPGTKRIQWDGKSNDGQNCSSGLYTIRLFVGKDVFTRKTVLSK